ncbi:MAG TPA: hypothetical protein VFT37_05995 [Telluria sp.]|nr:hypothetical protein [Telluria sp.]
MATDNTRPLPPATPDPEGFTTRLPAHGAQSGARVIDTGRGKRPLPPTHGPDGLPHHEGSAPGPDPG